MKLSGKNAIITGAAKRLGKAIALALADNGVNIAIHYNSSKNEAEDLAETISKRGLKSISTSGDIEIPEEIDNVVFRTAEHLGGLDILVNNAGIFYPTPIDRVTERDWDKFLNINLKAQFYFARAFARLKQSPPRKIINIADSYGISPAAGFIPYGVSKAGVIALTKGLAKEYAPDILVNAICPGPILPREDLDEKSKQRAVSATLLKREGSIEDIAKTVVFLAENDYTTGQTIFIDGGRNLNM